MILYIIEHINLCIIRKTDELVEKYATWMNNESLCHWIGNNRYIKQYKEAEDWLTRECKDWELDFIIVEKEHNEPIGICGLTHNDITSYLYITIGEEQYLNKGLGTEAINLLIKYSFEQLNMHRVELYLNSENIIALNCYTNIGFIECGRQHEADYYNGHYCDIINMEILKKDWINLYK